MASLQNEQIDQSYQGLIKTADNTATKPFPPVALQYGDGTDTPFVIGEGPAGSGLGDMVTIKSGNANVDINETGVGINKLSSVSAQGTALLIDGTYQFGVGGGPATNVDFTNATVTGLPSSGGGADLAEGQAITPALATNAYSMPWILSGYSKATGLNMGANKIQFIPFYAKAGESIGEFYVRVQVAQPGATMNIGLYKAYVGTMNNSKYMMPEYVADIALAVDVSTTGKKSFTGLDVSLPADAEGGCYWVGFQSDTVNVALTKWSQWVAAERIIYNDIYRGTGIVKDNATFVLPTGQVDLSANVSPSTDLPIDFAWRYKS